MKILASADHHFDEHSRFRECLRVHDNMLAVAKREQVDLFLSAGDIYERASTPVERQAVANWLTAMADVCPVVVAKGNHDRARDLEILGRLQTRHPITVVEDARVVDVAGAQVATVAWPDPASLMVASVDARAALQAVLRGLGDQMDKRDGPRILLGHFMVDGSRVSTGQPLLGQPISVGLEDLGLARAHLGVMGHIHRSQKWDVNGNPHLYVGSPFRTDFGQLEEKTMLLVEFDGEKLVRLDEIPTGATPMVHLSGEWDEKEGTLRVEWDEEQVAGAEVRLRYQYPRDKQHHGWSVAQEFKKAILECGALHVKVEGVPVVVKRARAPEVAKARTITEKLTPHWEAIGFDPGSRRQSLLDKARSVEEMVGTAGIGPTSLQMHRYSCENLGPHKSFSFDLDAYPKGSIVAFTGKNGAGKTTTLESAFGGTCYRKMPTAGTLVNRATARGSRQETVLSVDGHTYTIRHMMDAVSGKSESVVLDEQGSPAFEGTKVTTFDSWAARFLPDPSVLHATQFSSQPAKKSRERVIDLDSSERISVLLKALGVERIEGMAVEARKRQAAAALEVEKVSTRLADERERAGDIDAIMAAEKRARLEAEEADELLKKTREHFAVLQEQNREAQQEEERRAEKRALRSTLDAKREKAFLRRLELEEEIAKLEERLSERKADETLAARLPAYRNSLSEAQRTIIERETVDRDNQKLLSRVATLQKDRESAKAEVESLQARITESLSLVDRGDDVRDAAEKVKRLSSSLEDIDTYIANLRFDISNSRERKSALEVSKHRLEMEAAAFADVLANESRIATAVETLPHIEATVAELQADLKVTEETLESLLETASVGADERIGLLRIGLENVSLHPGDAVTLSRNALDRDDELVEECMSRPVELASLREKVSSLRLDLQGAEGRRLVAETLANRRDELVQAKARHAELSKELSELSDVTNALNETVADMEAERQRETDKRKGVSSELAPLKPLADQLPALEIALAVTEELKTQRAASGKRLEMAKQEERQLRSEILPLPDVADVAELQSLVLLAELAEKRLAEYAAMAATLEGQQRSLAENHAAHQELTGQLAALGDLSTVSLVDTGEKELAVAALESHAVENRNALAVAGAELKAAQVSLGKITAICQEIAMAEAELSDWTRLALDFGRAGIQSAEVDAAGPQLTDLANEILAECHGSRFRMSFDTSKLSSDGKKTLDEFRIVVLDSEGGREGDASTFSGGERVLLGECVESALLLLACIHNDTTNATIVRDESGAALDPENSRSYFQMLRLVARKVKASHLLLVTHSPELQAMADYRIEISTGTGWYDSLTPLPNCWGEAEGDAAE